jgi:putative addiction module component (TIGR02574 family)
MAITLEELTTAALHLPPSLRAQLVDRLMDSLREGDEVHPAWQDELDRRDAEMDRDPNLGRPGDDVFRRLRARLNA